PILASFSFYYFFLFNVTPTTAIYTLSLHDALPIYRQGDAGHLEHAVLDAQLLALGVHFGGFLVQPLAGAGLQFLGGVLVEALDRDRKSTRLNSSHVKISYAVFCLKKKKNIIELLHT